MLKQVSTLLVLCLSISLFSSCQSNTEQPNPKVETVKAKVEKPVSDGRIVGIPPLPNATGQKQPEFGIKDRYFTFDGKPAVLISGSIHYPRVPRAYWRDRMKKARAMGLNTISTYVFWNAHEKKPGQFNFSGNLDIAEFCKVAQEEGLWVIVRPGPYVCAEWDFGGLPAWLLEDPDTKVRTSDPVFMNAVERYMQAVSKELKPLLARNGGPIIMIQVENEYAVFGYDKKYYQGVKDIIVSVGFDDAMLIRCDWPGDDTIQNGHLDGVVSTMNFGDNPQHAFKQFNKFYPDLPRMSGEFWTGWFDHWGTQHHTTDAKAKAKMIDYMLKNNISFNMYMFFGGTNFGFTSGANWSGKYSCDTTSYDYSANLDEIGRPADKFYIFKDVITKRLPEGTVLPPLPEQVPTIDLPEIKFTEQASMFSLNPKPIESDEPLYMEAYGQGQGFATYMTTVKGPKKGLLKFENLHDRVFIIINGLKVATLDRRHNENEVEVSIPEGNNKVIIFVENMGHLNFSRKLMEDRKGIFGKVTLNGEVLTDWIILPYPLDDLGGLKFGKIDPYIKGPHFYRAKFDVKKPADTFLDMRGWGKGMVWVNGYNLGRYWEIGPQQTLFLPGCWMKETGNEIIVLDIDPRKHYTVSGVKEPVFELNKLATVKYHRRPGQTLKFNPKDIVASGAFAEGDAEQKVDFGKVVEARYVAVEALTSIVWSNFTAIAEIHMLDDKGKKIDRGSWKIAYADSEELKGEPGGADNIIDNQPTTFWHTQWQDAQPEHPHQVVIDLGKKEKVSALLYLPRANNRSGRVKDYKIYARIDAFEE